MVDDPASARPARFPGRNSPGSRPRDAGDVEIALDAILPVQPLSGQPITDGSEALVALRDRALDAERGFATLAEKAVPDVQDIAERFRELHERHASVVGRLLSDRGLPLDAEGSFLGKVTEAVVTVRAFFERIDSDVMTQVRDGEASVLKTFDAALAAPLPGNEAAIVRRLRDELTALLAQSRASD